MYHSYVNGRTVFFSAGQGHDVSHPSEKPHRRILQETPSASYLEGHFECRNSSSWISKPQPVPFCVTKYLTANIRLLVVHYTHNRRPKPSPAMDPTAGDVPTTSAPPVRSHPSPATVELSSIGSVAPKDGGGGGAADKNRDSHRKLSHGFYHGKRYDASNLI